MTWGMRRPVYILSSGLYSAAGCGIAQHWQHLTAGVPCLSWRESGPVGSLGSEAEAELQALCDDRRWRHYDRAVQLAVLAASAAAAAVPIRLDRTQQAVLIGSSRGATHVLEAEHERFGANGKVSAAASPMSTAGVFAAAVAQALGSCGLSVSLSSACSTSLNAIGLGTALVQAEQANSVVAGGAEAALTPFTLAQLGATGVLAKRPSALYPLRPMHPERSGMVPGEAAACVVLSAAPGPRPLARVLGFAATTEPATATGISPEGDGLARAVRAVLAQAGLPAAAVGLIVGHGAGTRKGDAAEVRAYAAVFGAALPPVTWHKWLMGHTLGAAGALSVALACQHLATGDIPPLPYFAEGMEFGSGSWQKLRTPVVLVTALGFGGAASALLISGGEVYRRD